MKQDKNAAFLAALAQRLQPDYVKGGQPMAYVGQPNPIQLALRQIMGGEMLPSAPMAPGKYTLGPNGQFGVDTTGQSYAPGTTFTRNELGL